MSIEQDALNIFLNNKLQISKPALDLILKQEKPLETAEQFLKSVSPDLLTILPKHLEDHLFSSEPTISLLNNFTKSKPIKGVQDLSEFFNNRYTYFRKLLSSRLPNPASLSSIAKRSKEKSSTIGLVSSKRRTLKGNMMIEIEDPTGTLKVIASKPEVRKKAEGLVMDEAIGVIGTTSDNTNGTVLFLDDILHPGVPISTEPKKLTQDIYAIFLSDTHIGSKKFMKKEFNRFLSWANGEVGNETQTDLVKKIRYCFVAGDIVDGIGIYPKQEEELEIANIEEQYQEAAELFDKLPKSMKIILSPGNHDFLRGGQPQPPLDPEVAAPLFELRNVEFVSNPSTVKIEEKDNGGLDVLMYHGVSFDTMIPADPQLKNGYTEPHVVMQSLLQRRHLSPPYDTGLVASGEDQMIIRTVPDIFHSGHVHSNGNCSYRGISIINSGTWQSRTAFQKLCGHDPTPAILPMVSLKTRGLNLINFNYLK